MNIRLSDIFIGLTGLLIGITATLIITNKNLEDPIANDHKTKQESKLAEENVENDITSDELLDLIDEFASHPEDPQKPTSIHGVTDEEIASLTEEEITSFIGKGVYEAAIDNIDQPRFMFSLGRVAMLHGYHEEAQEWLKIAADNGSSAALNYLAHYAIDNNDIEHAVELLEESVKGGFSPSQQDLNSLNQQLAELEKEHQVNQTTQQIHQANYQTNDFSVFASPELMKSLYNRDFEVLDQNKIIAMNWVAKLANGMNAQRATARMMHPDPLRYFKMIDPKLSIEAEKRIYSITMNNMDQILIQGVKWLEQITRSANQGGNAGMALMQGSINLEAALHEVAANADFDAEALSMTHAQNPEFVETIYANLKDYVYGRY